MDIIVYVLIGVVNGVFSSGAGQLLIFYLVYILKQDTKASREFSLIVMPIISIATFFIYFFKTGIDIKEAIIIVIISIIFGSLGNKLMSKLNPNYLNLVSGIFLVIITIISLWRTIC